MRIKSDSPSTKSKWKSIEAIQCRRRVIGSRDDVLGAGQQPGTDPDQQFDQQRFLVGEVPVDRGTADARGCPDVLQPHREKAALGDEAFRRGDQLAATIGFRPAAAGGGGRRHDVAAMAPPSCWWTFRLIVTNIP